MIKCSDISKIYMNGELSVHALQDISFDVKKGEFVSIMGPSGSGKTTLMNIIGCLDKHSGGSYILDGKEIGFMSEDELSRVRNQKIGFIYQTFNLLPRLSAYRNVELPMLYAGVSKAERHDRTCEALEKVGLADRMKHRPNELSGGQRQRVAIARSLVNRPAIFLADEPTGNLDSKSGEEIMAIFQELNRENATIVLVTHERDIAEHTGRVLTFKDGSLINDEKIKNPIDARSRLTVYTDLKKERII